MALVLVRNVGDNEPWHVVEQRIINGCEFVDDWYCETPGRPADVGGTYMIELSRAAVPETLKGLRLCEGCATVVVRKGLV